MTADPNAAADPGAHDDNAPRLGGLLFRLLAFPLAGALLGVVCRFLRDDGDLVMDEILADGALIALGTVALAYWLTTTPKTRMASAAYSLLLGLGLSGLYLLSQWTFGWGIDRGAPGQLFGVGAPVIFLVSLPFFRTVFERKLPANTYTSLFELAWNTVVIVIVSSLFLGLFFIVLTVWWNLFELIDISLFRDLFRDPYVAAALYTGAFAWAIAILRERESIILTIRGVLFALLHLLTPIAALAAVLFLIALAATGLEPLLETNLPIGTLIAVALGTLVLVNASLGDGERDGARGIVSTVSIRAFCLALPFFVGLAIYLLWLNTMENGLSVSTILTAVLLSVLVGHGALYFVSALLPRMFGPLSQGNIVLAGVSVLLAILVHTPVFDMYRWSAESQVARLRDGRVTASEFDYGYLKFWLGQAGRDALEAMASDDSLPDRDVIDDELARINEATSRSAYRRSGRAVAGMTSTRRLFSEQVRVLPTGHRPDPEFVESFLERDGYQVRACDAKGSPICALIAGSFLQADDVPARTDYLFMRLETSNLSTYLYVENPKGGWKRLSMNSFYFGGDDEPRPELKAYKALRSAFEEGDPELTLRTLTVRVPEIAGTALPFNPDLSVWLRGSVQATLPETVPSDPLTDEAPTDPKPAAPEL